MTIKYIITQINDNIIYSKYNNNGCLSLNIVDKSSLVGYIYIGRVENVVKNISSAFVEIENKIKCYYQLENNKNNIFLNTKNNKAVNIGDKLLVQVSNDAHKTKPPTATSKIDISGQYIVVSSDVKGVSISNKCKKAPVCIEVSSVLKDYIKEHLTAFNDKLQASGTFSYGIIIRSSAANADINTVLNEAYSLIDQYEHIIQNAVFGTFYTKLYEKEPPMVSELRHLSADNTIEVITDIPYYYDLLNTHFKDNSNMSLRLYEDKLLPLYKLYSVEKTLSEALSRKVWLKCGGYIIIEQTEAMSVVDVNSGKNVTKAKKEADKENNILKTNIEAGIEIIRQLRLRNISGIIIIDFINMAQQESRDKLFSVLKEYARLESIQTNVVDITPLGLVEMTRKNNGKTLKELIKTGE